MHINDVRIESIEKDGITLAVETQENITAYDLTNYAYKVMLIYYVNRKDFVPTGKYGKLSNEYPFGALREFEEIHINKEGEYISKWKIPLSDVAHDYGETYEYDLRKGSDNTLTIRLYGGTYSWNHVNSAPYTIQIPDISTMLP